jgi:hypothetical protein
MTIIGRDVGRNHFEADDVEDFDLEQRDDNYFLNNFDPNHMLMRAAPELTCALGSLGLAMYGYTERNIVETGAFVLSMLYFMGKAVCKSLRD